MPDSIRIQVEGQPVATARDLYMLLRLETNLRPVAERLGVRPLSMFFDWSELDDQYAPYPSRNSEAASCPSLPGSGQELPASTHRLPGSGQGPPASAPGLPADSGVWSDARAGVASVKLLLEHLQADPEALGPMGPSRINWPNHLVAELEHARHILGQAAAAGKRFRFLVVP